MKPLKSLTFLFAFLASVSIAKSQDVPPEKYEKIYLPPVIINGDTTLPGIILEPVDIVSSKITYTLSTRDVAYLKKVYPYALRTARILQQVNDDLAKCKTKSQKKRYTKETYKLLKDGFEDDIRDMTRIQGNYLCRLIYRETGHSVYDLIKEYKGGMSAGWWNFTGKFFAQDLKDTYMPNGRDAEMEKYVQKLDEIYQRNGFKKEIENEKLNTQIPGKKRDREGSKSK